MWVKLQDAEFRPKAVQVYNNCWHLIEPFLFCASLTQLYLLILVAAPQVHQHPSRMQPSIFPKFSGVIMLLLKL